MDARSFAQVALRLLAAYLILMALVGLPSTVWVLVDHSVLPDHKLDGRVFLVGIVFQLFVGVAIWVFSPKLARWMVGKNEASGAFAPLDVTRFQTVAFVALGMWLAIKTLSEIFVFAANWEWSDPYVWQQIVELVLSICLILGAKSLARLARSVREFGAEQDQK